MSFSPLVCRLIRPNPFSDRTAEEVGAQQPVIVIPDVLSSQRAPSAGHAPRLHGSRLRCRLAGPELSCSVCHFKKKEGGTRWSAPETHLPAVSGEPVHVTSGWWRHQTCGLPSASGLSAARAWDPVQVSPGPRLPAQSPGTERWHLVPSTKSSSE